MPLIPTQRFCRMETLRTLLPTRQSQTADRLCADLWRGLGPHLSIRVVADEPLPLLWIELHPYGLAAVGHAHVEVAVVHRHFSLAIHAPRHRIFGQVFPHAFQTPGAGLVGLAVGAAAV